MIDIHTHILPELDDGSSCVDESINMLEMLSAQGVGTVVATPHFYINETDPENFLNMRSMSVEKLKNAINNHTVRPEIAIGAEFQFYSDIHKLDCIEDFCISGTKYILLEMPFAPWSKYTFQALEYIYTDRNITPIIAHLERYLEYQGDFRFINKLKETHSLVQINSSFLVNKTTRRKALSLIKKGVVNFVASDSHNVSGRPPVIKEALDIIGERLGDEYIDNLNFWEERLLKDIKIF